MTMSSSHWVLRDQLAGGLIGLLVGDALGVPYEFHDSANLPSQPEIDMAPPSGFQRAHAGVAPGTWSDDGAQALVLLDSLLTKEGLDLSHFADGLQRWLHAGFCAVDGRVFDVGIQTSAAIRRLQSGVSPDTSGPADERSNGNGALMRVLPLALWNDGDDLDLINLAARQSLPTHGHMRSQVCCALYCLWARAVLQAQSSSWDWAVERLQALANAAGFDADEVSHVINPDNASRIGGSGYVLDTLWSARAAVLDTDDYAGCVRRAISYGHDTDTTACVAGGIAGLLYGWSGIPRPWRDALLGREILQPLLKALLQHRDPAKPDNGEAKTSLTHPIRVDALKAGNGWIGLTFCPGKQQDGAISGTWRRDLTIHVAAIRDWGASDVLSLIEPQEFEQLQVQSLGDAVRAAGMRWHHLPIADAQAPDARFETGWPAVRQGLMAVLDDGGKVHVHCKGGIGRAGTVATLLLRAAEPAIPLHAAMQRVRAARHGAIETRQQELYLARHWKAEEAVHPSATMASSHEATSASEPSDMHP